MHLIPRADSAVVGVAAMAAVEVVALSWTLKRKQYLFKKNLIYMIFDNPCSNNIKQAPR